MVPPRSGLSSFCFAPIVFMSNDCRQWIKSGFPALPQGLTTEDYYLLHHNLKKLEAVGQGVNALFWKVDKAFILGAGFDVMCRLDDHQVSPKLASGQSVRLLTIARTFPQKQLHSDSENVSAEIVWLGSRAQNYSSRRLVLRQSRIAHVQHTMESLPNTRISREAIPLHWTTLQARICR